MSLKRESIVFLGKEKNVSTPLKHISKESFSRSDVSCSNFFSALSLSLKTLTDTGISSSGSGVGLSLIFLSSSFFQREIYSARSSDSRGPDSLSPGAARAAAGRAIRGILLHGPSGTPRSIYLSSTPRGRTYTPLGSEKIEFLYFSSRSARPVWSVALNETRISWEEGL